MTIDVLKSVALTVTASAVLALFGFVWNQNSERQTILLRLRSLESKVSEQSSSGEDRFTHSEADIRFGKLLERIHGLEMKHSYKDGREHGVRDIMSQPWLRIQREKSD